jgi:hypothetical protein
MKNATGCVAMKKPPLNRVMKMTWIEQLQTANYYMGVFAEPPTLDCGGALDPSAAAADVVHNPQRTLRWLVRWAVG